ncbi:hypothetical protein [Bacillus timonensis]|uniref:hypothetical protein n=1 Tax=Bacillus timonensis TaxID=1033734 RepID=UPI000289EACA|nr:hypothetical protein [Bacillus timonensis]
MNISKGIYHTIYHPRLIIIPLIVNVILSSIGILGVYFSFVPFSFHIIDIPFVIPLLNDINTSHKENHWILSSIATIVILLIKSYAFSMYLGSMKCFLEGPDNTYSVLKIAPYYFDRMVIFSITEFIISGFIYLLFHIFWPLAIVTILIVALYSLTPFILVLEDTSVRDAIAKSPRLLLENLGSLLFISLLSLILFLLIANLPIVNKNIAYYVTLLLYCFIGTVMVHAVMDCLHKNIYHFSLPSKKVKKTKKFFLPLWIVALLLPILGALLVSI